MKKKLRFSQLSEKAYTRAVKDYLAGWKETHEEEEYPLSEEDALDACRDTEDQYFYDENGKMIEDLETVELIDDMCEDNHKCRYCGQDITIDDGGVCLECYNNEQVR